MANYHVRMMAAIACVIMVIGSESLAQPVCETNFTGNAGNDSWHDPANWFPSSPDSTLVACIPADKIVRIHEFGNYDAEAVWVKRDANGAGLLRLYREIAGTVRLRLYADSQVDGTLEIGLKGALQAMNDITIKGTNGDIFGTYYQSSIEGSLDGINGGSVITFKNGANGGTRANSITVHGTLLVQTPVINDKAFIVADTGLLKFNYYDIRPSTTTKGGYWIAEKAPSAELAGTLNFQIPVSGYGTWQLVNHDEATILIVATCKKNGGPVFLQRGRFEVKDGNASDGIFMTTGRLTMESVNGAEPQLIIRHGAEAQFDN